MRITIDQSVALCIDVQDRLFPHIDEYVELEARCIKLILGLQTLAVPILVSEQYPKGLGTTILAVQETLTSYEPLEKSCFSCAEDEGISGALCKTGRRNVILFGIEAHVCVLQTTLDLLNMGLQPVVIVDCVGSRSESDKSIALQRMRDEGAILSSCESILFELCRVSGTPRFKEISQLVK